MGVTLTMTKIRWLILSLGVSLTLVEGGSFSSLHEEKVGTLRRFVGQESFTVQPTHEIVFPQVADGVAGGMKITTAIILTNAGGDDFVATLNFRRSDGEALSVELDNLATGEFVGSDDTISVTIPASQSVFLETRGSADLAIGWARASVPPGKRMGGVAVYRLLDPVTDRLRAIVGVGASSASPAFSSPVVKDDALETRTALALANNSDRTAHLAVDLLDSQGSPDSSETLTLGPGQQSAKYIDEMFPELGRRFYGTVRFVRVDADGRPEEVRDVHPVVLFQQGSLYTSAPVTTLDPAQRIAAVVPTVSNIGPTEAGKQDQDTLVVAVEDAWSEPVSGATYRWATDEYSGWVYPSEGITGPDGRISATWIAGSPGIGSLTLKVANAVSARTAEIVTESVASQRPPSSAINLPMRSGPANGYSIDLTPLTEPGGTYYAAIHWDGGYTGLQRAGSRYDRQLQFSVWDVDGIDARVIQRAEDVICSPFGGEGTGQKCELNYPWRVGATYRFEVTEEELDGGSVMTLHVTDVAADQRRFVGALRYGRRANLSWMNMFVEDFRGTAPTCLSQPVRSAAIRRGLARIDDSWHPITSGILSPHREDAANPGTPACANVAARDHPAGLEVAMGGRTAGGPLIQRQVAIPPGESQPRGQ